MHSCSDNCPATFLKIVCPGHQRSGHQVRSSDPTSKNFPSASRPQWLREIFEAFRIWYTTKYLQSYNLYISYFYIGDIRSGHFRDLPIISQWGKNSITSNTYQICLNRSEPCSLRLLLLTSVQLCICDPGKVVWGQIITSWGQCTFLLIPFDWIELESWGRFYNVPLVQTDASNDMQHDLCNSVTFWPWPEVKKMKLTFRGHRIQSVPKLMARWRGLRIAHVRIVPNQAKPYQKPLSSHSPGRPGAASRQKCRSTRCVGCRSVWGPVWRSVANSSTMKSWTSHSLFSCYCTRLKGPPWSILGHPVYSSIRLDEINTMVHTYLYYCRTYKNEKGIGGERFRLKTTFLTSVTSGG